MNISQKVSGSRPKNWYCYDKDMSTSLTSLIQQLRSQPEITAQSFGTLRQTAAYTRPDLDDAQQAVALGRKEGVEALLGSPKLAPDERQQMATQMLQRFAKDPLAAPRQSEMLSSLLANGANVQAPDSEGKTPLDHISERLERMNSAEQALNADGRPRHASGAGVRLRQLRDELVKVLPITRKTRVDVAQFESGLGMRPTSPQADSTPQLGL